MKVTCIVCYELLSASEDVSAAPCGHMLHFHCWIGWLERTPNCPECRKTTHPNQLIRLYFNAGEEEDYSTLINKYDSLQCELQCKISEVQAANEILQNQKEEIDSLESKVRKWKTKVKDMEKFNFQAEAINRLVKDSNLEKYWFNELQIYKEEMSNIVEQKDAEIKKYRRKLERLELQAKQAAQEKAQKRSDTATDVTAEEKRKLELRRLPRGCVLHLLIPPSWRGDHPDIRREIERLGGRVAFVTYRRGDKEAYVRLHVGNGNPAQKFMSALQRPSIVIDNVVMFPRILEGDEELKFLKQSLVDRDRWRAELRRREERNPTAGASSGGPSRVTIIYPRIAESVSAERIAEPVRESVIGDLRDYVSSFWRSLVSSSPNE